MSCLLRRIPPQVAPRRRGSSLKPNRGYPQPASAPAVRFGPPKTALRRITEIRFPCGGLEVTRRLKSPPTEAHSRPSGDCGRPSRRAELPRREANAPSRQGDRTHLFCLPKGRVTTLALTRREARQGAVSLLGPAWPVSLPPLRPGPLAGRGCSAVSVPVDADGRASRFSNGTCRRR